MLGVHLGAILGLSWPIWAPSWRVLAPLKRSQDAPKTLPKRGPTSVYVGVHLETPHGSEKPRKTNGNQHFYKPGVNIGTGSALNRLPRGYETNLTQQREAGGRKRREDKH